VRLSISLLAPAAMPILSIGLLVGCASHQPKTAATEAHHRSFRDWARRYNAAENGTLGQELAREDLEQRHGQLIAAVNQACPGLSDTATERACEAVAKVDPACQQISKQETHWETQGGKDPVADPAADSLMTRCDHALQQHCGYSPLQCEQAEADLKDFQTRLENAEMEQAFLPGPATRHSSVSSSAQHTDCQPWMNGFTCHTMPGP